MRADQLPPPLVSLAEAQGFLRVETGEDEALIAGFIRTASALCEQFIGQAILVHEFCELLPASREWQRLRSAPARSVAAVNAVTMDGAAKPLAAEDYAVDIDADGRGWVRCLATANAMQVEVRGTAGLAEHPNDVPEPLRQGVLRLTAHLFANRDGPGGEPPAAVTALWRPYRRMSLR